MITRQEPDVAILDVGMPRMDGLAVLEKLKQGHRAPRVGVIMLTGNDSKQNAETSTYWYADAYLTKPCSAETLMAAIHRSLSCRATARNSNQSI